MKQETKELLDYIISTFNLRTAMYYGMPDDEKAKAHIFNCRQDKIQDFLKSIPEIESKLCQGGYIQDVNGVPCCNGDKVKIIVKEGYRIIKFAGKELEGRLAWNKTKGRFYVITRHKDFEFEDLEYPYVTKVE